MDKIEYVNFTPGERVRYMDGSFFIKQILDLSTVLLENEETQKVIRASRKDLLPIEINKDEPTVRELIDIPDKDWQEAERRFSIIIPILENRGNADIIKQVSKSNHVSIPTLYRWIKKYETTGNKSALAPAINDGGKGKARLPDDIESIIEHSIEDIYLKKEKKSIRKVCLEVISRCKRAKLNAPHPNTVRNRILVLSEELKMQFRIDKNASKEKYQPHKGSFPGADYPLAIVQIDHTKLDIILVDKVHRKPIGRPWITLAMDVHSRTVLGFYISFDPPGALSVGMCICNSIMSKEMYLDSLNVTGEWPCYGLMKVIHADNAKEFRGNMLQKACSEYNIQLNWRPVKKPHWGGHIERLLGTMLNEIHSLPGTTFSKPHYRKYYDSEKNSILTIEELEKWLATYIVEIYHQRVHTGIGQTPLQKWEEGILGSPTQIPIGLPRRITNETKLRLDFLPYEERTIQEYGVVIDYIHYYGDVLRKWINALEPSSVKAKIRRKFIFKRDARNISVVYFFDPDLKEYKTIPYKNNLLPPISIWEFNQVVRKLKEAKTEEINEDKIFNAYHKLKIIEENAVSEKKMAKAIATKAKREHSNNIRKQNKLPTSKNSSSGSTLISTDEIIDLKNLKPFEELEHGTFNTFS